MKRPSLLCLVAFALLPGLSIGQMSTLPAANAIADLPGAPKNPPIFSQMTVIWQGGLQYQDTVDIKGSVANVEREETQSPNRSPYPYHTKTTLRFDDHGRVIKRIVEEATSESTTTNVWESEKLHSQTVEHHRNDGKFPDWSEWQRWSYDTNGRLSEFRAGRDKQELNDYVNFQI
jgi:hypothetical protein